MGIPQIHLLNVRLGNYVASHRAGDYALLGLVFTPDGKGLLGASSDHEVDVSWLASSHWNDTDGQREDILGQDFTEISRFIGHKVRLFLRLAYHTAYFYML